MIGLENMNGAKVQYKIEKKAFYIVLSDSNNGNLVCNETLTLITKYIKSANENNDVSCIVLMGENGIFSKGMDFKEVLENSVDYKISSDYTIPYKETCLSIRNSSKPVIASIDGDVIAGGVGLMLSCDIVLITKDSKIGLTEVLFGIIPCYVFPLLLERISIKKARSLILSSKILSGEEAYSIGLADLMVSDSDELNKRVKELIKRINFSSPKALDFVKIYSDKITDNKIGEKLDYASKTLTELLNSNNVLENIKKFLDGEKIEW